MSRLIRVSAAAALAAAVFAPAASSSAALPCEVVMERHYIGGTTWTAVYFVPTVHCTP